jgi:hypothetical protein
MLPQRLTQPLATCVTDFIVVSIVLGLPNFKLLKLFQWHFDSCLIPYSPILLDTKFKCILLRLIELKFHFAFFKREHPLSPI